MTTLIDVWNLDTFDAALMGELLDQQQLLIDYFATDRTNYLEREASDRRGPIPSNPHAGAYYSFAEHLIAVMQTRTIRAWHHTRAPRVLEIAVPLSVTPDAYSAATAVIALYARSLDCHADWGGFDLYASSHLGPEALLRVHSGGEHDFARLARGYPAAFHDRFGDY